MLRKTLAVAAIAGFAGSLAACGGSDSGSSSSDGTVTFFSNNVLTGQSEFYGNGSLNEENLLAKKINDAGGFKDSCGTNHKIKIISYDNADDPAQSVAGMQKAAADPSVLAVLGSTSDIGWIPAIPVAGQLKIPMIIPSDGSTVPEDKWNEWSFRIKADAAQTFALALPTLVDALHIKRVAVLYDITQDSQAGAAELWKTNAEKLGYQVVAYDSFRRGDTDFRSQLSAIKAKDPDFLVLYGSEPSGMYNQAKELGLIPAVPASSAYGINATEDQWKLTNGAVEGSYTLSSSAIGPNIKMHDTDAMNLYKEKYGVYPNTDQILGWDAVNIAVDAVKRSCTTSDRDKFRQALAETTDFPQSTQGTVTWKNPPTGENLTPTGVVTKVVGPGKVVIVK